MNLQEWESRNNFQVEYQRTVTFGGIVRLVVESNLKETLQVTTFLRKTCLWIFLFGLIGILLVFFPAWTPSIKDSNGHIVANSVSVLERLELGGLEQSILIRGRDRTKPVLLFLHGGPGYPQIAYARKYQEQLENDFVVVNWDQRGSGKSYHWGMSEEDMKLEQFIEDTHELTQYLKQKFNQPKIYIVGHSWGSLLGIWTVQKHPEDYFAYIGVGQVVDSSRGELISYEYVLEEARRIGNAEAIRELEDIGPPPYENSRKDTTLERKWVMAFGGSERNSDSYRDLIRGVLWAPEYTWLDGVRLLLGDTLSRNTIMPQKEHVNLLQSVPELKVPVYICSGRFDYMTPAEVAYQYYEMLATPKKEFIWFEESAHFPHFEEAGKFHALMLMVKEQEH
jgi:pimeloyl-ACP methyl ester carboxylesterase